MQEPVHVAFSTPVRIGAIVLGVLFVVFVAVSSYTLVDQLRTVRDQDRKQTELIRAVLPLLEEVRPAAGDVGALLDDVQPVLREADRRAPAAADAPERTRRTLRDAEPLVRELRDAGAPGVLADLGAALGADRLTKALGARSAVLGDVERRSLVERASIVPSRLRLQLRELRDLEAVPRVVRAVERTVVLQEEALALQRRLFATQEEALRRIISLDRKTGGSALTSPAAP